MHSDTIEIERIEVEGGGLHLWLAMEVEGKPVKMVLDTGASRSVFDKSFISELESSVVQENEEPAFGVKGEQIESKLVYGLSIKIGKFQTHLSSAVVMDLKQINEIYHMHVGEKVAGILGSDVLQDYQAIIDFGTSLLHLKSDDA